MQGVRLRAKPFDFEDETEFKVPIENQYANVVVLAPVIPQVSPPRFKNITDSVNIFFEHDVPADTWNVILESALPLTGYITTSK